MNATLAKLQWFLNRLRSMSLVEMGHRLQERRVISQDRSALGKPPHLAINARVGLAHFQQDAFFLEPEFAQKWSLYFAEEYEAARQTADALLNQQITLFHTPFQLDNPIDWHKDLRTGQTWPQIFYQDVDTRDGRTIGGVKWVWELNRHHHLVTLGKAYYLTGNECYAQAVVEQLQSWIATNPPFMGVNWTSALELALRLINWTWALHFIKQSAVFTEAFFAQVVVSLVQQASYIARHLSAHSSANNHLMGEAAGLAFAGICYPWLPAADQWRETGMAILARELPKQIYPDGGGAEQTPAYLAFVLDFNLIVWRLAELKGYAIPAIWFERFGAACDFLHHLLSKSGQMPAIGDDDDAWVVRLDERPSANNYHSLLNTAAVLLGRAEFKHKSWDVKSHLLLGENGRSIYNTLADDAAEPATKLFLQAGYAVLRDEANVITFDCGPLGYLATAAHGHADALGLTWHVNGEPLLIDPGTYAYQEGYEWRDYFRSTAAHNTAVLNKQDQSEMRGAFLWGKRATARVLQWQSTAHFDWVEADHDGYADLGITHRRSLLFMKPNWLLVVDDLSGKGSQQIEQFWHLHPQAQVVQTADSLHATINDVQVHIRWLDEAGGQVVVQTGQQSPRQGWYSAHYGHVEPAPVIRYALKATLPQRITTLFCLVAPDPEMIAAIQVQFAQLATTNYE